jgi:hypothetical protein
MHDFVLQPLATLHISLSAHASFVLLCKGVEMIWGQKETDPRIVMLCGILAVSTW